MDGGNFIGESFDDLGRQVHRDRATRSGEVAEAMAMTYANFHSGLHGRARFRADEVNGLIRALPDIRICDYLLEGTPFIAVQRSHRKSSLVPVDILCEAIALANEAMAIVTSMTQNRAGGPLAPEAYCNAQTHVRAADRVLASLNVSLSRSESAQAKPEPLQSTDDMPRGQERASALPGKPDIQSSRHPGFSILGGTLVMADPARRVGRS